MGDKYNFVQASYDDLVGMAEIEKEFFGNYSKAFDLEFLRRWYKYNSSMFYVVKDEKGDVLAFTIMTPITKNAYDRMLCGTMNDMYDFLKIDVLRGQKSDYYYVSDICVSKEKNANSYFRVVSFLMAGLIKYLSENAYYILVSPVTKDGTALCEHIGFKKVASSFFDGNEYPICELIATEEYKNKYKRFTKILDKKE